MTERVHRQEVRQSRRITLELQLTMFEKPGRITLHRECLVWVTIRRIFRRT